MLARIRSFLMARGRLRTAVATAVVAAAGVLVLVVAPNALAGPTAPDTVFTVDGRGPSSRMPAGPLILDPSNAIVGLASQSSGNGFGLHANALHVLDAGVNAPAGSTLATGTYATTGQADATHAGLTVSVDQNRCASGESGTLTITQLERDPDTHAITVFAADYSDTCVGEQQPVYGSLRWHATVGYATASYPAMAYDFGTVPVGQSSPAAHLTLTSLGSDPLTVATAALDGTATGAFSLAVNTCVGTSVAYGQTCTIDIVAHPSVGGDITGTLTLTDNTAAGTHTIRLSVLGDAGANGEISPSSLSFGTVPIGQSSAPKTVTITSTGDTDLTMAAPTLTGSGAGAYTVTADTCTGVALSPGSTCTLTLRAAPTAVGSFAATLTVVVNTVGRALRVNLTVVGPTQYDATPDPATVDFGAIPLHQPSPVKTVTITSTGTSPVTLGTATVASPFTFAIVSDTCSGRTLDPHATCTIGLRATPQYAIVDTGGLSIPDNAPTPVTVALSVTGVPPGAAGTYYPLAPQRLMDTRTGNGAPKAPIGPGGVVHLQVSGRGGVPATGVGAVVLNVTVTAPTVGGYVTAYPTGVARPTASSLNFVRGWTGANSVTVALGTNGRIDLFNLSGTTQVIVDVLGFYASSDAVIAAHGIGGQFQSTRPQRLVDTRLRGGALGPRSTLTVSVDFGDPAINGHIRALAVNITAVTPTAAGYLSAWSGAGSPPTASTLNFTAATIVPNFAVVPSAPCTVTTPCSGLPSIAVYNASPGATQILIDMVGVFDDSTLDGGLRFHPVTPTRIADSRRGQGMAHALGTRQTATVTTPPSVAGPDTIALAMNVTAIAPTTATYLTVWPSGLGLPRPTVSNLNPAKGQTVPNAAITVIGPDHAFNVYNFAGTTNVAIDVVGTFEPGITIVPGDLTRLRFRPSLTAPHPLTAVPGPTYRETVVP